MSQTQVQPEFIAGGLVPIGGIIMWSGSVVSIPTGWALCNGSNGTPNLQDRFVVGAGSGYAVGATGGSANATLVSHSHTGSTNSTKTADGTADKTLTGAFSPAGNQAVYNTTGVFTSVRDGTPETGNFYNGGRITMDVTHSHTITTSTEGSSATNANLPPYYALAFIMRVS
jgi:microcystin-dependent protein